MAQYNFEGDFSDVSERQLEFINNVVLEQGFQVDKVTFAALGIAGDNYSSNVKRIKIEGEKTMSMVVKLAPTIEMVRQNVNTFVLFKNEHLMYLEVLPKLLSLQKVAGVPESEWLRFAKCYGSLSEPPNEVIILEDLKESDYGMENRLESLSDVCVREVLKNFAIYHSLSYVLKKQDLKSYDYYKNNLIDLWAIMDSIPEVKIFFRQANEDAVTVLKEQKHIDAIKNRLSEITTLAAKFSKIEYNNKYSVIAQGDSWTNNIMFRYPDENKVESVMVDYQLAKNGNPVVDIMYMIFNCTDHETRSKHFNEWLDHYHTELDRSLSNFGMKANFVYPRDQLDADMKRYGKFLLGLSLLLANVLIRKSDEAAILKESVESRDLVIDEAVMTEMTEKLKIANSDEETVKRFRNRIVGLVESFDQFGLL